MPFPSPGDLLGSGIELMSPSLAGGFLTTGEAQTGFTCSVPQQGRISYGREGLCPLQLPLGHQHSPLSLCLYHQTPVCPLLQQATLVMLKIPENHHHEQQPSGCMRPCSIRGFGSLWTGASRSWGSRWGTCPQQ